MNRNRDSFRPNLKSLGWRLLARVSPHAAGVGLLALMLVPQSMMLVAAKLGYEMHVVSFLIGPATYIFGDGLVPGIDYFTQYSVGLPYIFSWLLNGSADHAVLSYVWVTVVAMFAFYAGLFYMLWWLFSSWLWALGTTITVLILQFHVERTFFDPSSYVLRYPLLVGTIAAVALWVGRGQRAGWGILVACAIGGSLFLNTETGLYQALAVAFVGFFASRGRWLALMRSIGVVVGGVAIFFVLSRLAFGPAVFSLRFCAALLEPFTIYGGGFGGAAIDWRWGWHLLYNVIAPGAALVTMTWGAHLLWTAQGQDWARARIAAVVTFGVIGILMSAKYSNMSLVALWHVSSLGFLVTLAWWGRQLQLFLRESEHRIAGLGLRASTASGAACSAIAMLLLWTADDPRNPTYYALNAYLQYPSFLKSVAVRSRPACVELGCAAPRIHPDDVKMIRRLVPEKQRVAVYGWYDWAYLIEAHRASFFQFLPSQATFTRSQLAAATRLPDIVFLPHDGAPDLGIKQPELSAALVPALKRDYAWIETGHDLMAWRRQR